MPMLVFYGVGVTVGAGIFALIGEILKLAGDRAPAAFLLAGVIAGITGFSYALLVRVFPRAGGEAVFVNQGLGAIPGLAAGLGVVLTGIVSSAVIALAFAGYVRALADIPEPVATTGIVALLSVIAWWGVRESVIFASAITVIEVGTLIAVFVFGLPLLSDPGRMASSFMPGTDLAAMAPVLSGAVIAFFAFIGFEDIENMAEETLDPAHAAPRAIILTLLVTVFLYVALALVAVMAPDRTAITQSSAPLAVLFEQVSGRSGAVVASIAAVAMINGILVQIVMASRVLYGMSGEGLLPSWLGRVDPRRRTPANATLLVAALILVLALAFPLVRLAEATSLITLAVFAMVNLSLVALGRKDKTGALRRWWWWGVVGALASTGLAVFQVFQGLVTSH